MFLVLIVVLAGGIFASAPWWTPRVRGIADGALSAWFAPPGPSPIEQRLGAIETASSALNTRLTAVEQKPAPATVAPAAVAALEARTAALERAKAEQPPASPALNAAGNEALVGQAQLITSLTARIATLEAAIGNVARLDQLAKEVETLSASRAEAASVLALADRVAALENTDRDVARDRTAVAAVVLATAQLRSALDEGRAFAVELETVAALASRAGFNFERTGFADFAARGLATSESLSANFSATAGTILRSDINTAATDSLWARTIDRILSIATIRPVGDVTGMSATAVVARAEARLANRDLAAAVEELGGLTGPAADAAESWLAPARARVAADAAVIALTNKAIAGLGQATGTGTSAP